MLKFTFGGMEWAVSLWFPLICLWALYAEDGCYVLLGIAAAMIHEAGHLLALVIGRVLPERICLSAFGMRFELPSVSGALSDRQQIIMAAAGPLTNAVCAALLYPWYPSAAVVHGTLAVWNLLPLYPLDGERIVRYGLLSIVPEHSVRRVQTILFWLVWPLLCGLSLLLIWHNPAGGSMLFVAVYIGVANFIRH